jgi:GNAT superfamily N-acetyltransferase
MKLTFKPLTEKTWNDFEDLFGARGACGGCWCMAWRLKSSDFEKQKGAGNKKKMKSLVKKNEQIGIIGYIEKKPIAWCSVAPREKFIRLESSRVLKKIDDEPVWSILCFFISREFRRKGLSTNLMEGVIAFCKKEKVKIIEGYPTVPYNKDIPAAFAWTGVPSAFEKAGFKEITRRSKSRPIMRYYI